MKKSIFVATLALTVLAGSALAQPAGIIGVYADVDGVVCSQDFPVYASTTIYVVATLYTIPAITAAEFNLYVTAFTPGVDAIVTPAWNSPLTIGDVLSTEVGFSIAFSTPQEGPVVNIGTLTFFVLNGAWPGSDLAWCVIPTPDLGNLNLVDDEFNTLGADAGCMIVNCDEGPCDCLVPVEEKSWGEIKALY